MDQSKGLESIPVQSITELTLEKKKKMPALNLKQKLFPVYGTEKFTVNIGKWGYKDQLAAKAINWNMGPDKMANNFYFLAWVAQRMIKKADPYFKKSVVQVQNMLCDETVKELDILFKEAITEDTKKKIRELNEDQASPLLGKI